MVLFRGGAFFFLTQTQSRYVSLQCNMWHHCTEKLSSYWFLLRAQNVMWYLDVYNILFKKRLDLILKRNKYLYTSTLYIQAARLSRKRTLSLFNLWPFSRATWRNPTPLRFDKYHSSLNSLSPPRNRSQATQATTIDRWFFFARWGLALTS